MKTRATLRAIVALHNATPALLDAADELTRFKSVWGSEEAVERVSGAISAAMVQFPGVVALETLARAAIAALVAMIEPPK